MNITGSLIEAYIFCPRQAWLMARQITGDQSNEFIEIGRFISEQTYRREKKEISFKGGKIDFIKNNNEDFVIVEVKKSEKFLKAAKMQVLFYLMKLKEKGYNVKGEIRIPKSKKVVNIALDEKEEKNLKNLLKSIEQLLLSENMPEEPLKTKCKNCSYFEFCWS